MVNVDVMANDPELVGWDKPMNELLAKDSDSEPESEAENNNSDSVKVCIIEMLICYKQQKYDTIV